MARSAVAPETLKTALSASPSAVTVVTVAGGGTEPHGITVSSFTSGSLDPPLVLVGLDRDSATNGLLADGERGFCVNVLAAGQRDLAEHFAGMADLGEPFRRAHPAPRTGAPAFDGSVAVLDCEHAGSVAVGDHVVHVGRVVDARTPRADARPLAYCRGEWRTMTDLTSVGDGDAEER